MNTDESHIEEENCRLRRATEELAILNEIAVAVSSTMSLDQIVASIVDKCVKHLKVEQGAVMLFEEGEAGSPFRTMVRKIDTGEEVLPFRFGDRITGWMMKNQKPLLINDLQKDPRFQMGDSADSPIRSLLSVPLVLKGRLAGLLSVFNKRGEDGFAGEDQRLLSIIAVQSAQVIENARVNEIQRRAEVLEAANREIREATERKSRFLASMSHELRTPMTAIKGHVDNMLDGIVGELTERQRRSLKRVIRNSDHLLNLINELLDLSKIEAGRMDVDAQPFDVKELVAFCCDAVRPLVKPDVSLKQEAAEDVGQANSDQGRLRQIVINLLSNALKFTEQGEVAVRVSRGGRDGEAFLVIAVSDTGTGIPAEALDSIFEEFQQVKGSDPEHKGTGLGLPIVKGFAELLGGSVRVESEAGKGSTFVVQIPMVYRETA